MKKINWLGVGTVAIAMVLGTSAFADSRHREGTSSDRGGRSSGSERSRSAGGETVRRGDAGRSSQQQAAQGAPGQNWRNSGRIGGDQQQSRDRGQERQYDRQQGTVESYRDRGSRDQQQSRDRGQPQSGDRNWRDQQYRDRGSVQQQDRNRGRADSSYGRYDRNDNRTQTYGRGNRGTSSYGRYDRNGRSSMLREGRVERIMHERGGYRVWLGGFGFPFWIPEARWSHWPLRVGISIRLGGWWDPLGYYNVYDVGAMGGYYNTAGDIHGVVESVDYRRGTAVVRDDISNSFVTVLLRGNDPRLSDLRPGDYVDVSGQWTRGGIFEAFRLEALNAGRSNDSRYDRDGYPY